MDQTCNPNTKKFKSKNQEQNVLKYIVDIGELNLDQRDYSDMAGKMAATIL